ncbi:hypothetical protein D3C84_412800 [compost metagenome]
MAAFRAAHGLGGDGFRSVVASRLRAVIRDHPAEAGDQVLLFAHLGTGALQRGEVLVGLGFHQVALERDAAATEQAVDLAGVTLEQTGEVSLDGFQRHTGHGLTVEDDLVAGFGHAGILVDDRKR